MIGFKKYRRKIRMTYIASAIVICAAMIIGFPWIPDYSGEEMGYYIVSLNGEKIGSAESKYDIQRAINRARVKLNKENGGIAYVSQNIDIKCENRLVGATLSEKELSESMYEVLKKDNKSEQSDKEQAFVVDIEDFSVTLSSEEEVVELLKSVKSKYDEKNEFDVDLVDANNEVYSYMTTKTHRKNEDVDTSKDGVADISFAERIQVMETYVDKSEVVSLQTAIDDVTKDKAEKEIYTVCEGDCLSTIAEKYDLYMREILAMNPGLTAESIIGIGDQIAVTVPKPELSVLVTEQKTYQEAYNAEVQYVYNDSKFTTDETVITEGAQGLREVVAKITSEDGSEISREILSENILQEAVPRVVEKGTIIPPSYIKPLAGGVFTSGFGARWGTTHKGVDWACPVGTAINASCGGRIVIAGWVRGYGYCVEIAHSDGKHTRYGHLSQILVSVGDVVNQGERVALSGNTGDSTGPHVHFEIIVGGSQVNPLDYI